MMTLEYVDNESLLQLLAHNSMPQKLEKSLETMFHNQYKVHTVSGYGSRTIAQGY